MKKSDVSSPARHNAIPHRSQRELTDELRQLEAKLRLGGGPDRIEKQHSQGKLTARERIGSAIRQGFLRSGNRIAGRLRSV